MANKKPEDLVKFQCLSWMNSAGFSVQCIESKAVYSARAGRYLRGQTKKGTPDIIGTTPFQGVSCYCEVKAAGRIKNLSSHQVMYLEEKIKHGAFACVTDSHILLASTYKDWVELRAAGKYAEAQIYLLKKLADPKS
jgi:hypothetical protein